MKESFNKFKKKILIEALIKSIVISSCIGLIIFSIPYIYVDIKNIEINGLYLYLIATFVTLISFGLLFLIFRPTDIKVAKRLDRELKLNEKVQTMIEYENEDSFMVKLQKENTLNILSNIPLKKLSMKFGIMFFVTIMLACSLCVGVVALSIKEETPIVEPDDPDLPVDPDYDLDNWTIVAILEIIKEVKASTITESLKTKYVTELEGLIKGLEDATKESEMLALVNGVIDTVQLELDKVNTNNEISTVLKESGAHDIVDLALQIELLDATKVRDLIDEFIIIISGSKEAIIELDDDFRIVLKESNLNRNDALVDAIFKLSEDIKGCENSSSINSDITAIVLKAKEEIAMLISHQAENKKIADYIESELKNIFGLNEGNIDDPTHSGSGNPNIEDPNQNIKLPDGPADGGLGKGEILFGSNDAFFDPEKGLVEYGDVITSYYGALVGKFNDGTIPEELKEFFEQYYEILFGIEEDEEE